MWKIDEKKCIGCSACTTACPVHILELKQTDAGMKSSIIDQAKCTKCMECVKICPVTAITVDSEENNTNKNGNQD